METKETLKSCKRILFVAFIMYTLGELTAIRLLTWVGTFAVAWLFLNVLVLIVHMVTPDYRKAHYDLADDSLTPADGVLRREFSIPLPMYILNIQVIRRKEKVKWN